MKQSACLFFLFLLTACQPATAIPAKTLPSPPIATETITPSPIPTQSFTPSPIPTFEELIFPYTVDGLRQREYQSGEIRIRETLGENDLYTTYSIDYSSDGLTITGVMLIPVGEGPFPVIVMNHGFFARSIYNSGDGTDRASEYLARQGYITIASDYRSWGESDEGESFFYSGLVIDVINLLNAIPSIPQADPNRIGMWGHSMGGGVTIKALVIDSRIKAAVLYSTVSANHADIIERWGNGCFGDVLAGEQVIGCNSADIVPLDLSNDLLTTYANVPTNENALQQISPIHHLELVNAPIQIHYGTRDGLVYSGTPPAWSLQLTQALRSANKEVELYQYEDEGHSFVGQPWFDFMGRVLRFFNQRLK